MLKLVFILMAIVPGGVAPNWTVIDKFNSLQECQVVADEIKETYHDTKPYVMKSKRKRLR